MKPIVKYNDIFIINDSGTNYIGSDGNICEDPQFVDYYDWHLTALTPVSVTHGGTNLDFFFKDDLDENQRTEPWSMGAYEFDGKTK